VTDHNDDDLAQVHPWDRLITAVAEAQTSVTPQTWSAGLAATSAPAATAETVAAGWLAAQPGYARAKGYITADQFASLAPVISPDTVDTAWLKLLTLLPAQQRSAIVQAPAKRQLYWHMLPLATALRNNRALDLSLNRVNTPTWHRPSTDLALGDLDWFAAAEGLIDGSTTIALLASDPYLRHGPIGDGDVVNSGVGTADRLLVVRDKGELFDFVYQTVFAGYVEPIVAQYQNLLTACKIKSNRSALYASGLFGLAYPPYAEYQAQVAALQQISADHPTDASLDDDPRFRQRAEHARRVGERAADSTVDVVVHLGRRKGYRGLISPIPVRATDEPEIAAEFPTRICCRAHGGRPSEPIEHALECTYCGLNNPALTQGPAADERLNRLRHRLKDRGQTLSDRAPAVPEGPGRRGGPSGLSSPQQRRTFK
jgi:hypothetical protein